MRWASKRAYRSQWHWRFAHFPVRLDDGSWVWRERYRARYVDVGEMWPEYQWQRHLTEGEDW